MNAPVDRINLPRMADDLWQLVNIPSPTGGERAVALAFADMLSRAGARVELDETLPQSPSVIGRLRGSRPGGTFQLAGHLDHIDVPHDPPRRDGNVISGRGSADMKNGLAAILETVRVLAENGSSFPGEILVTAYGLHEAPAGDSSALLRLIERGVKGHAALVAENSHAAEGSVVIQGKGQSIWNLTLRRSGEGCHELNVPPAEGSFFEACTALAQALNDFGCQLSGRSNAYPLLSPESLFVGQMHYGDFYNRAPASCTLQGTRRWLPDRTFEKVRAEMDTMLARVKLPAGMSAGCEWTFVGESYAVDPGEPVVAAQQRAFREVTGRAAGFAGLSAVVDANRLVPAGSVPTVLLGFDNEFAHADHECVRIDKMLDPCRILLKTVQYYLEGQG